MGNAIRIKKVREMTGLSRATIYRIMEPRGDFPAVSLSQMELSAGMRMKCEPGSLPAKRGRGGSIPIPET